MSKSNQKNRKKTHVIILALEKVTQLVALALVAAKKKAIINSKSATLLYFDRWKRKQQDQGGKCFYFSFIN